jgi:hypothetical protein
LSDSRNSTYRVSLKNPISGEIVDTGYGAESASDALYQARLAFAARIEPDASEADLERIGDTFDLLALHPVAADFREGWHGDAAQHMFEEGLDAFVAAGTAPVISSSDALSASDIDTQKPLLILVHPGSLMGSYKQNYLEAHEDGEEPEHMLDPAVIRQETAREVLEFDGDLAAVIGDFSDEIQPGFGYSRTTLADALGRIGAEGMLVLGEPEGQSLRSAATTISARLKAAERPYVLLSGAWADEGNGCLDTVALRLHELGCNVHVSDNAAWLDHEPRFPVGAPDCGAASPAYKRL